MNQIHLPQEIGRAGRDGLEAHCHLFLDSSAAGGGGSRDLNELRRHIHSNSVDAHTIRKLLTIVFNDAGEREGEGGGGGGVKQGRDSTCFHFLEATKSYLLQ